MVHTAITENPTKKPTKFTSIQNTHHQLLKKFHNQSKRDYQLCHHRKIFFRSQAFFMKTCLNSGCKTKLQYQQPKENNQNKMKRKRNIIWFNPPYSKSVKTIIGRILIKLISKQFPSNCKFVKIFNKNTIKFSYSCMSNVRSKMNGHNKKIQQPKSQSHKNYAIVLWIMFNVFYIQLL